MFSKNKIKKLIFDPNRFFFDYFSKRIGLRNDHSSSRVHQYLIPPGYVFKEKIHPWIQISEKFNLQTGATTGHPDQSLLLDCRNLLDLLMFTLWIAHGFKSAVRLYTLGGGFQTTIIGDELLNPKKSEWIFSKIHKKPDFIIEFLGEFDNNFAAHLFIYDQRPDGVVVIRSNQAFIKKSSPSAFEKIYPSVLNKFGNYGFSLPFPVDVVFTWVNKDDLKWIEMWNQTFPDQLFDSDRYSSRDELRFSLRAICKFLPWFHKIYIVSNCARPDWLKDHPQVYWVRHEDIFPDISALPTFNSHAIESCLHKIKELSEKFIYFNDDVFLNQPCYFNNFFDTQGRSISFLEPYGSVCEYNVFDDNLDYLLSSINSKNLVEQKHKNYHATRLHKHTPHCLNKSILEEIENNFSREIKITRSSRLRSPYDINLTSFMYHHYALALGQAIYGDFPSLIVRPSNIKKTLGLESRIYKFLCFNDGNGSAGDESYNKNFIIFIKQNFPHIGTFEMDLAHHRNTELFGFCLTANSK